ncbi:MAG: hypothetical protein EON59_03740 [Alphaproteobacteria bacterium]|nr:MAG: hypothetical protein EON59_03740 [Alphaproteobacteria bacterium]
MSTHDFHQLSPLDFESLVRDLLQAELKIRLESFAPGRDGGIDFRFSRAGETTVIQAKHFAGSPPAALLRAAKAEDPKVAKLQPKRYILATSQSLTPHRKDELIAAMPQTPLVREDILSREDLNNLLGRHPDVLRQHFKLWLTDASTLERIIHSGVYNRTDAELDIIKRLVPRFVHNNSIAEAEAILGRRGALIVAGDPGVGKTTLARVLTWLHLEQGWKVFVVDDLKEAMSVCTAGEKRLIVFDDFLGQISLTSDTIRDVDQRLPVFLDRVKNSKDLRFILTTRSYLMNQAQLQSSRLASSEVKAAELVLRVGEYTRHIRARIVYNHIFFSGLTTEEKRSLLADDFYLRMVDHANFSPRLIDLLTSPDYQSHQSIPLREVVTRVLNNPEELWATPFRSHFSDDSRTLMVSLFFFTFWATIEDTLHAFTRALTLAGVTLSNEPIISRYRRALKPLEGSVVSITNDMVMFSNPGVSDFLSSVIIADRLLVPTVKAMDTSEELDSAWNFYIKHRRTLGKECPTQGDWIAALQRCVKDNPRSRLEVIALGISVGRHFDETGAEVLEYVETVLQSLAAYSYDIVHEGTYRRALARYDTLDADEQTLMPSITVVTQQLTELLAGCGEELTLDEIASISEALTDNGEDDGRARAATEESLRGYVKELDKKLSGITSPSELDQYETRLSSMLDELGMELDHRDKKAIECHREYLDEEYNRSDTRYSPSSALRSDPDATDAEVRSLFATLDLG